MIQLRLFPYPVSTKNQLEVRMRELHIGTQINKKVQKNLLGEKCEMKADCSKPRNSNL